ncbi:MAG: hypothetical protein Q7R88_00900 [bacterium]|nr:hypothetical protein [bacterium]
MRKIVQNNIERIDNHRQWLFWVFASIFFLFSALYVYFVNTTTLNGVRWREAEGKSEALSARMASLETTYLSQKRKVTLTAAYTLGFEEARGVRFVTQKTLGVVSLNNEL